MTEHDPEKLDYYQRLGTSEHATSEEIEAAYKALRRQFHPDAKPAAYRDYFDHAMKGINEARDVLRDPAKRRRYDARLRKKRGTEREERPRKQRPGEGKSEAPGRWAKWREHREKKRRATSSAAREERRREEEAQHARRRATDQEIYALALSAYQNILNAVLEQLEVTREALDPFPARRLECDELLAEFLADPQVQGNLARGNRAEVRRIYAEERRRIDRSELGIRQSCDRVLRLFREAMVELDERLNLLEGRTDCLPTQRRAELRSIRESIEREAAALMNPGAEGSR